MIFNPLDTIRGGSSELQCTDLVVAGQVSVRWEVTNPVGEGLQGKGGQDCNEDIAGKRARSELNILRINCTPGGEHQHSPSLQKGLGQGDMIIPVPLMPLCLGEPPVCAHLGI